MGSLKLSSGQSYRVVGLAEDADAVRLMELGLTPGAVFTVLRVAPLGDPQEFEIRGSRVCVRRSEMVGMELEAVQ